MLDEVLHRAPNHESGKGTRAIAGPLEHQAARHHRGRAEAGFGASAFAKAALGVELHGARIGGDHQGGGLQHSGELRRLFHEEAADAASPEIRLNEQAVEFGIAILARKNDGEAGRRAPVLGDDDQACGDLFSRQLYRVRMLEQVGAVVVPLQRRAALEVFKRFTLGRMRGADGVGNGSTHDFVETEEEIDLALGAGLAVRAVHRVLADRLREELADRAVSGLGRVGGTHDLAMLCNSVVGLKYLEDDGTGGHEVNQLAKETAGLVLGVEAFGLGAREANALLGDDAQAVLFKHGVDRAGEITLRRVRLDDRKRTLGGHVSSWNWLALGCRDRPYSPEARRRQQLHGFSSEPLEE